MSEEFSKDLLEKLLSARELVQNGSGKPVDMYHPDYGWIIKDGEAQPASIKFYKDYIKSIKKKNRMDHGENV